MNSTIVSKDWSLREIIFVSLLGALGIVLWGLYLGQDYNPDLINYHLYSGHLAFHKERLTEDIFASNIQGYLNPYLYTLFYVLYQVMSPKGVGIVLAALHSLCFVSSYVISKVLLANWLRTSKRITALICASFGVINPFFLSMVGSSFSDNFTPPLILIPLAIILVVCFPGENEHPIPIRFYSALFFSGILLGTSVGFKLTNCAFIFGLLPAWFVCLRFAKKSILGGTALFGGIGIGFLIVNGEWMWRLFTEFQNPTFPFYNEIFKSPIIGPIFTNVPAWAAAHSFYDLLVYPFRWVVGIPPVSEWPFRDPRFAFLYILILSLLCIRGIPFVWKKITRKYSTTNVEFKTDHSIPTFMQNRYWFIGIWSIISYLCWIDQFGCLRYLLPITLLTGILLLICVTILIPFRKIAISLWLILLTVSVGLIQNPPFTRLKWKHSWYPVQVPETLLSLKNALFVISGGQSYVIPFFQDDARFIGIDYLTNDDEISRRAQNLLTNHKGPIRTLAPVPISEHTCNQLAKFGLRKDPNDCVYFNAGLYTYQSCLVERISPEDEPIVISSSTELKFAPYPTAWINFTKGFSMIESEGMWTQGDTAIINLAGVLPKRFKLRIIPAHVFGENERLPFKLVIGKQEKEFTFQNSGKIAEVAFTLDDNVREDTILIKIPKPTSPHSLNRKHSDHRKLGMMLNKIIIEPDIKS